MWKNLRCTLVSFCTIIILLVACVSPTSKIPITITKIPSPADTRDTHAAKLSSTPIILPTGTLSPLPLIPAATLLPYTTPAWFNSSVLYEIFVRSFEDSDGDGTGDLKGITQRMDYIQSLGANAIWLMPVYPSPSVHGYDVTDYMAVNPDYGTLTDLQALVKEAHALNIKVILDFVPSHCSNEHPFFKDAFKNPASPYSDWFVWTNDAHTAYAGFAGNETMPRFNHYNPVVVDYLSKAALYWLDLDNNQDYTDGIDGLRVDNATFPPAEFFIAFREKIKQANPNALLLGEAWVNTPFDLARFYLDQFDALFDFPFYALMAGDKDSIGDGLLSGKGFPILVNTLFEDENKDFPPEAIPVRLLSNHDTNRIASKVGIDPSKMRLAAALLAAMPGPVMVYYGEEIGMLGQKGGPPYWDNYRREPLDWYASGGGPGQTTWFRPEDSWNKPNDGISVEEETDDPKSLLNYYRQVFKLRYQYQVLTLGTFNLLDLKVSGTGPWGFTRSYNGKLILAIYNFAGETRQVSFSTFPISNGTMIDLLTDASYPGINAGQAYTITLPASTAIWLSAK